MILLYLTLFAAPILCQFPEVEPDVRFGEGNDRFDFPPIVQRPSDSFMPNAMEAEMGRRLAHRVSRSVKSDELPDPFRKMSRNQRRSGDEIQYHDKMESGDFGDKENYEKNLKAYMPKDKNERRNMVQQLIDELHEKLPKVSSPFAGLNDNYRKNMDPDLEVLLHHALPIDVKVEGYMQPVDNNNYEKPD